MGQITKNFTFEEFGGKSIPPEYRHNISLLTARVLQPLRNKVGPIQITSGYRSPEKNREIGGAANSQHLRGEAADFKVTTVKDEKKANILAALWIAQNCKFDQLIVEEGGKWIHVSYRESKNRNQILSL